MKPRNVHKMDDTELLTDFREAQEKWLEANKIANIYLEISSYDLCEGQLCRARRYKDISFTLLTEIQKRGLRS